MNILIDMNLSPDWLAPLSAGGHQASHWSTVGNPKAADAEIMQWAREHRYIVLTHDLDFGALLAATSASGPSVLQVRAQDTMAPSLVKTVLAALAQFQADLERGALVVVEPGRVRARVLPLAR